MARPDHQSRYQLWQDPEDFEPVRAAHEEFEEFPTTESASELSSADDGSTEDDDGGDAGSGSSGGGQKPRKTAESGRK